MVSFDKDAVDRCHLVGIPLKGKAVMPRNLTLKQPPQSQRLDSNIESSCKKTFLLRELCSAQDGKAGQGGVITPSTLACGAPVEPPQNRTTKRAGELVLSVLALMATLCATKESK